MDRWNTYVSPDGRRQCRECLALVRRRRHEREVGGRQIAVWQRDRTHCIHGHSLADCYVTPDGRRQCRICRAQRCREARARKKGAQRA